VLPISIRGVSRRFGGTLALDRMDLEVGAGEFVALVGPSGCGKTTLLRIVADLDSPSSGEVRIGSQLARAAREQRLLGLVSQRPAVLPWKRAIDDVVFTQRIARRTGFRNVPYVALVTVLSLALGDTLGSKVAIVVLAGFFPVMVNTYRGLLAADPVVLDRMRVLSASPLEIFVHVRLPYALPYIVSAQEITGSGSIIVAIAAEWMISGSGLGYVINRAMQQYRGDQVYAVALLAALLSFLVYSVVHVIGRRLDWQGAERDRA
jgi:ABC-type sugar transport system ATPase subunit